MGPSATAVESPVIAPVFAVMQFSSRVVDYGAIDKTAGRVPLESMRAIVCVYLHIVHPAIPHTTPTHSKQTHYTHRARASCTDLQWIVIGRCLLVITNMVVWSGRVCVLYVCGISGKPGGNKSSGHTLVVHSMSFHMVGVVCWCVCMCVCAARRYRYRLTDRRL